MRTVLIDADLQGVKLTQVELFQKAISRMESVLSSDEFMENLKSLIGKSNNLEGELSEWKNKTAEQIFEQLFVYVIDGTYYMSLQIETYYTSQKVIGYGLESDNIIRVNTKYTNNYTLDDESDLKAVGSNLLHEESHNRGFKHDFNRTARRRNSISYILNEAYEMTYDQLFMNFDFREVTICYRPWYFLGFKKVCTTKAIPLPKEIA